MGSATKATHTDIPLDFVTSFAFAKRKKRSTLSRFGSAQSIKSNCKREAISKFLAELNTHTAVVDDCLWKIKSFTHDRSDLPSRGERIINYLNDFWLSHSATGVGTDWRALGIFSRLFMMAKDSKNVCGCLFSLGFCLSFHMFI